MMLYHLSGLTWNGDNSWIADHLKGNLQFKTEVLDVVFVGAVNIYPFFRVWCDCSSSVRYWQDSHICYFHPATVGDWSQGDPSTSIGPYQRTGSTGIDSVVKKLLTCCIGFRLHNCRVVNRFIASLLITGLWAVHMPLSHSFSPLKFRCDSGPVMLEQRGINSPVGVKRGHNIKQYNLIETTCPLRKGTLKCMQLCNMKTAVHMWSVDWFLYVYLWCVCKSFFENNCSFSCVLKHSSIYLLWWDVKCITHTEEACVYLKLIGISSCADSKRFGSVYLYW